MRFFGGGSAAAAFVLLVSSVDAGAVPRPFEPLRVDEQAGAVEVALWGRSYRFGAGPLPSEVRSQGVLLFSERPRFRSALAGSERDVVWQPATLIEASPEVVRLRSVGTLPGVRVQAETRVEYDGMIAVDLALQAEQPTRLERLQYEVALPSSALRFFAWHLPYDYEVANVDKRRLLKSAGPLPDHLALPFVPTLALGDPSVGVEWWSETNAHWREGPGVRPFEVVRDGAVTRLRVTPIGAPLALERGGAWRDAFAFFVFPSRPPPERWRSVRFLPHRRAARFDPNIGTRFVFLGTQSTFHARHDGLPASVPDSVQRSLREELEQRSVGYMPYGMLMVAPILHPRTMSEFDAWSADGKWWRLHEGYNNPVIRRTHAELGAGAPYTYAACAARKDYFDWMLEENVETLVTERLDALYFDHGAITRMCLRNPVLAGQPGRESWEYRNVREFYKRLYERVQQQRPGALIVIHSHGAPKASGAFVDFHMIGEALNAHFGGGQPSSVFFSTPSLYTPDYLALPDGYLDAQVFPRVGGVTSVIPQIKWAIDPKNPQRARGFQRSFLALVLSNDVHAPMWASDLDTSDEVYRALDRFGDIGAAVVHPWWTNEAAIRRPGGLRVTAWVRDGRALLVLANLGGSEWKGRLDLDRTVLGVPGVQRVLDLEKPGAKGIKLEGSGFDTTVPPRDLRILALE
jgi:hypothetical protein